MENHLGFIKPGERVWLTSGHTAKPVDLATVIKVTATQIVVRYDAGAKQEYRFYRDGGRRVGGSMFSQRILRVATDTQATKWDKEQEMKRLEREQKADRERRIEELRQALSSLFGDSVDVSTEHWGDREGRGDKWTVAFHFLDEDQVRRLAELVGAANTHLTAEGMSDRVSQVIGSTGGYGK